MTAEEALLEGYLGVTRELLSFQSAEKKYHIGSEKGGANLIKVGEDDIPADKNLPYVQIFSRLKYLAIRPSKYLFAGNNIRDWVPK
jgi:hypothetical protein